MSDRYMSIKELVEYSGMSERTLRDLLDEIPHYRPRKKILVKRSEFDEWINNYRVHEDDLHPAARKICEKLFG